MYCRENLSKCTPNGPSTLANASLVQPKKFLGCHSDIALKFKIPADMLTREYFLNRKTVLSSCRNLLLQVTVKRYSKLDIKKALCKSQ